MAKFIIKTIQSIHIILHTVLLTRCGDGSQYIGKGFVDSIAPVVYGRLDACVPFVRFEVVGRGRHVVSQSVSHERMKGWIDL